MSKKMTGCRYDAEKEEMIKKEGLKEELLKEGFYPVSSSGRCYRAEKEQMKDFKEKLLKMDKDELASEKAMKYAEFVAKNRCPAVDPTELLADIPRRQQLRQYTSLLSEMSLKDLENSEEAHFLAGKVAELSNACPFPDPDPEIAKLQTETAEKILKKYINKKASD